MPVKDLHQCRQELFCESNSECTHELANFKTFKAKDNKCDALYPILISKDKANQLEWRSKANKSVVPQVTQMWKTLAISET